MSPTIAKVEYKQRKGLSLPKSRPGYYRPRQIFCHGLKAKAALKSR